MEITDVRRLRQQGHALLELKIDGIETTISAEQKRTLLINDIVYAGAAMEDKLSVVFRGHRMRGCTNDPDLVRLVQGFVAAVYNGTLEIDGEVDYS